MNVILILRILILISAAIFLFFMLKDCWEHRDEIEKGNTILFSIAGFLLCFTDCFGIGNMATSMAFFRLTKTAKDEQLAPTGNVAFCVTTIMEFVFFATVANVDSLTLVSMIVSAVVGSIVGASFVTKLNENTVRKILTVTLVIVAILTVCKANAIGPFNGMGTALGLRGIKLVIGIVGIFFLGCLQTMGIGMFATTMALVSMLGMDLTAAFPIMMGACGFVMPWCSIKFVKEGKYQRKASLVMLIPGILGILFAVFVVKSMSLYALTWVVAAVMLYTSFTFYKQVKKNEKEKGLEGEEKAPAETRKAVVNQAAKLMAED